VIISVVAVAGYEIGTDALLLTTWVVDTTGEEAAGEDAETVVKSEAWHLVQTVEVKVV